MPATANKRRKKAAMKRPVEIVERPGLISFTAAAASGALLGLSAPGLDQWYFAWVGLIPLLLLTASANSPWQAFFRGLVFGTAYNLVYLNWYLALYPLDWLGFNQWQSMLLAAAAWLIVSLHQGLIIAIFAALCRLLPLTGGLQPRVIEERWHIPAILIIPLLWVLWENKLGNAPDLSGVPWSMIEYSQYRQVPLIQAASAIGGIGIGLLIVAVNVTLAGLLATISRKADWRSLASATSASALVEALSLALVLAVTCAAGYSSLAAARRPATSELAVVQPNINIDMQKTAHRYTLAELLDKYTSMLKSCRSGIYVLTESAVPTYLRTQERAAGILGALASQKHADLIIGAMDRDASERPCNSAYGITRAGEMLPTVYHKRYLVPFGEYTPRFVEYMPEPLKRLTNTPSGGGFAAGRDPAVLALPAGKIAPLICFETMSPELVASSVRAGGTLLVNLSDLAWFHDSMIGRQMIAFSVMRAVENRRYFVFAANSGPSAIIDPTGKITVESACGSEAVLTGKVGFDAGLAPFTFWFR